MKRKKASRFIVDHHHKVPEKRCVGGIVNYCTHIASKKLIYSVAEVSKKETFKSRKNSLIYAYPDIIH